MNNCTQPNYSGSNGKTIRYPMMAPSDKLELCDCDHPTMDPSNSSSKYFDLCSINHYVYTCDVCAASYTDI